jgi:small subunit ribosomal protein S17e
MGRIKTTLVKRMGNKIYQMNKDKFKKDFDINKKILPDLAEIPSKKLRNIIAGYITRLANQEEIL